MQGQYYFGCGDVKPNVCNACTRMQLLRRVRVHSAMHVNVAVCLSVCLSSVGTSS